jgi:hypothetical protein
MKTKQALLILVTFFLFNTYNFAQENFNKTKDLLLANYDLKADEDDIHAATAFGSMLKHSDLKGIKYYVVAGAYGIQECNFITISVPQLYNTLFGVQNINWTDANSDRENSIIRVSEKIKTIIKAGGKVYVAEGGQSDVTYDALQVVIKQGISISKIKSRVIVIQHSKWNEDNTTPSKLDWVKTNTTYKKIADGNVGGNGTPGYNDAKPIWLNMATGTTNTNAATKKLWLECDAVCDAWTTPGTNCYSNPVINGGGVDFSDAVEMWWIFNVGTKADTIDKFWTRYVNN